MVYVHPVPSPNSILALLLTCLPRTEQPKPEVLLGLRFEFARLSKTLNTYLRSLALLVVDINVGVTWAQIVIVLAFTP